MPLDLEDLAALRDLTASAEPRPLPRPDRGSGDGDGEAQRETDAAPAGALSRRRLASLAAAAAAAGLLCGLVGPSPSALAQPLTSAVRGTLFASASPVAAPTPAPAPSEPTAHTEAQPSSAAEAIAAVAVALPLGLGPGDLAAPRPGAAPSPAVKKAWVPTRSLPKNSGTGRRIVYAEQAAHLWIVAADGRVLRDYKVTGRPGRPGPGTYRVFSKSPTAVNPGQKLRFELMVRFTHGVTGAAIGFHTIPETYQGVPIQKASDLGKAIGSGGCVRQKREDARWLYRWVKVGDTVVVLR
ncbi:L,D-transpeptidase [Longivirga aurantiaca]|uniref:L,D-transpeptidase n=1 Tax=Longivirga aurantiaca TaxID=1837743 RepID=A0ABW1T091_9ACTN